MDLNIPITKYVNIYSSFKGGNGFPSKEPIGRILSDNVLLAYGETQEFTSLADVSTYFGANSRETQIATKYFGFTSKKGTRPNKISFSRYSLNPVNAYVLSGISTFTLSTLQAVTEGEIKINYTNTDGTSDFVSKTVDLSGATSFTNIAELITTALADTGFTASYSTNTDAGDRFQLSATGDEVMSIESMETDLGALLGWNSASNPILCELVDTDLVNQLNVIVNQNNNFYTFAFANPSDLSLDNAKIVASWNESLNVESVFICELPNPSDYATWQSALASYDLTWIQYDAAGDDKFILPMAICACFNPDRANSIIDFMFQIGDYTPDNAMGVVGGSNLYKVLDSLNINYYASTQFAGGKRAFLQNGVLQGKVSSATVAMNAIWLKAEIIKNAMELFLLRDAIPANAEGKSLIIGKCVGIFTQAINNGVILVDKALSDSEKATIAAITGDENAWIKVFTNGYIFETSIEVNETTGQKYFNYRLIYAAADTIHSIEGTNIAITSTANS